MARRLDEGGGDDLARMLWEKRQLPPSWLDERTPHELLFLFAPEQEQEQDFDPVDELRRLNHERLAPTGARPVTPAWLMPKVPRVRHTKS